jgi:HIV Tat-specific factor 1
VRKRKRNEPVEEEGVLGLCRDKETGMMKGDALITFLQRPSVSLACTLMHGRPLRPLKGGRPMSVQEAKFEPKVDAAAAGAVPKGGQNNSAKKGGKGGVSAKGTSKKAPSQIDKALGWGGFDDKHKASEVCNLMLCTSPHPFMHSFIIMACMLEIVV